MGSILLFSTALFFAVQGSSQEQISGVEYFRLLTDADRMYSDGKYLDAVNIYERLAKSDQENGSLFEKISKCYSRVGKRDAAAKATLQMSRLGYGRHAISYYQIARNHALNGDEEKAIEWLEKSMDARWFMQPRIQKDAAFESLGKDPRFAKLAGLLPERAFTRDEGWRYDIEFFAAEVARLSGDPERYGVSQEFQDNVKKLIQRVPRLSNEHIALEIQTLAASLGNGHSNVYPMPTEHVRFSMLPIQLYLFSDGMYVVDGMGEGANLVGHKVLSLGTMDVATLMEKVKSVIHRDNEMGVLWLGPQFLGITEVLEFFEAIETASEVPIKLQNREGEIENVVLKAGPARRPQRLGPARPAQKAPLYLQNVEDNYWFRELPKLNAIYFQFNQVRNKKGGPSIRAFAETLSQSIKDSKPQNLIVDLRHNNGGAAFAYEPLVRPLVFFEMMDKKNRLFIITGRNTFSAAQNFLNAVEPFTSPIIVGEPSSGRPNSVGGESEVQLPWSGLRMSIAYRLFQDSKPNDFRPMIPPHLPLKLSSGDYFSHQDPMMDAVKEVIREGED